jgi:hypothetical protein
VKPEQFTEKTLAFLGTMGVNVTKPKFYVDINFDAKGKPSSVYSSDTDTIFRIRILPEAWEVLASKPKKTSWARFDATTNPWVSDDALGLFAKTPAIDQIPALFRAAEKKLAVTFPRVAFVRTNLVGAKKAVTSWVATL